MAMKGQIRFTGSYISISKWLQQCNVKPLLVNRPNAWFTSIILQLNMCTGGTHTYLWSMKQNIFNQKRCFRFWVHSYELHLQDGTLANLHERCPTCIRLEVRGYVSNVYNRVLNDGRDQQLLNLFCSNIFKYMKEAHSKREMCRRETVKRGPWPIRVFDRFTLRQIHRRGEAHWWFCLVVLVSQARRNKGCLTLSFACACAHVSQTEHGKLLLYPLLVASFSNDTRNCTQHLQSEIKLFSMPKWLFALINFNKINKATSKEPKKDKISLAVEWNKTSD